MNKNQNKRYWDDIPRSSFFIKPTTQNWETNCKRTLIYHTELSAEERQKRVIELLTQVGIPNPERCAKQYPHDYLVVCVNV